MGKRGKEHDAINLALAGVDVPAILAFCAGELGTSAAAILSPAKQAQVLRARRAVAHALIERGISVAAIARALGKHPSSVRQGLAYSADDTELRAVARRAAARGMDGPARMPLAALAEPARTQITRYLDACIRYAALGPEELQGLRMLAGNPEARMRAGEALMIAGHPEHRWTPYAHATQMGMHWVM